MVKQRPKDTRNSSWETEQKARQTNGRQQGIETAVGRRRRPVARPPETRYGQGAETLAIAPGARLLLEDLKLHDCCTGPSKFIVKTSENFPTLAIIHPLSQLVIATPRKPSGILAKTRCIHVTSKYFTSYYIERLGEYHGICCWTVILHPRNTVMYRLPCEQRTFRGYLILCLNSTVRTFPSRASKEL